MHADDTVPDGAVLIPLRARDGSIRAYAIVDADDVAQISQWRWCLTADGYAMRGHTAGGHPGTTRMHRDVLGLVRGDGVTVDHINRDRLDNRRANLRKLPKGANAQNMGSKPGSSSRFRGVTWTKGKWQAQAHINGQQRYLGRFDSEEEAARVASEARAAAMPYTIE